MSRLQQITATPKVCDDIVSLGIKPVAFFWNIRKLHPEGKKDAADNPVYVWETVNSVKPLIYVPGEVVPAWTMEELFVLLGGDQQKPDIVPDNKTSARIDPEKKETYLDYQFALITPYSGRYWPRGADLAALILRDLLQRSFDANQANIRYNHFFKP